jgi:hypothetical protein
MVHGQNVRAWLAELPFLAKQIGPRYVTGSLALMRLTAVRRTRAAPG